jgi:sulfite exporter TauE/SafE
VTQVLTIGSALLLGLVASGHCLLMCGGITAALGLATARNEAGRARPILLLGYQLGRITSYTLAGALLGTLFGRAIAVLDIAAVRDTLRVTTALVLLVAAFVVLGLLRDPGALIGRALWPHLAPLGRRLLPVNNVPRAWAFGMIWGWMPCGFVYTVLLIAAAQGGVLLGAGVMAAFGLGTLPALFLASYGTHGATARFTRALATKHVAGGVLLLSAAVTFAAPWLLESWPALHHWLPFDCVSH